MTFTRRHLIRIGQALMASAAVSGNIFGADGSTPVGTDPTRNLLTLSKRDFTGLINGSFAVHQGTGTTWLTLLSVDDMSPKRPTYGPPLVIPPSMKLPVHPGLETFALRFSSTGNSLPQDTYLIENNFLGRLSMFLVPSGPSMYTAIISRFADAPQRLNAR